MEFRDIRLINGWHVTLFGHTWALVLVGVLICALVVLLVRVFAYV
jgi:hypothetical protein